MWLTCRANRPGCCLKIGTLRSAVSGYKRICCVFVEVCMRWNAVAEAGGRTQTSGIRVRESKFFRRQKNVGWVFTGAVNNSSSITGKSPLIKTVYKKKHSPSLGIQNQDQSFHLHLKKKRKKKVSMCAHVRCKHDRDFLSFGISESQSGV